MADVIFSVDKILRTPQPGWGNFLYIKKFPRTPSNAGAIYFFLEKKNRTTINMTGSFFSREKKIEGPPAWLWWYFYIETWIVVKEKYQDWNHFFSIRNSGIFLWKFLFIFPLKETWNAVSSIEKNYQPQEL